MNEATERNDAFKPGDRVEYTNTGYEHMLGAKGTVDGRSIRHPYIPVTWDDKKLYGLSGERPDHLRIIETEAKPVGPAPAEPTDEQRRAVEWMRSVLENSPFPDVRNYASSLLKSLPDALTNPQPAEPGLYVLEGDMSGSVWRVEVDGTIGQVGGNPFNKSPRGPFTRLVPERPRVTREQIDEALRDPKNIDRGTVTIILDLVNGTQQ